MLCEFCGKEEATVHLTEINGETTIEKHLCAKCAKKISLSNPLKEAKLTIQDFLEGMLDSEGEMSAESGNSLKCDFCGLTYREFRETGRLGCSNCYQVFSSSLRPLLRRIHGAKRHIGKSPLSNVSKREQFHKIRELRARLEVAIAQEAFEEAAKIRDEIRELEKDG